MSAVAKALKLVTAIRLSIGYILEYFVNFLETRSNLGDITRPGRYRALELNRLRQQFRKLLLNQLTSPTQNPQLRLGTPSKIDRNRLEQRLVDRITPGIARIALTESVFTENLPRRADRPDEVLPQPSHLVLIESVHPPHSVTQEPIKIPTYVVSRLREPECNESQHHFTIVHARRGNRA